MKKAAQINIDKSIILPRYQHLIEEESSKFTIEFLYGGRDSSKSYTTAEILIIECLKLDYFRCALIREQSGDIKDSQWQLIKDIVEEWQLQDYFEFRKAPLEIECKINNNKFIARGCNEPQNLKSITACNRAWIEEGIKERESMTIILGTLRSNRSKVKLYYTFNPEFEGNYKTWWFYEDWFEGYWSTENLSFEGCSKKKVQIRGKETEIELNYRVTHSTYRDNPYVSLERIALHESNKGYYYTVYTLGLFGYKITGGEFWTGFKSTKHTEEFDLDENSPLQVVIDSNTAPYVTIGLWQVNENDKVISQVYELPCRSPNASSVKSARKLSVFLNSINYDDSIILFGDSTANNKSTVDENNASFFDKFFEELKNKGWKLQNRIGKSNPRVSLSCDFINEIYEESADADGWTIRIHKRCVESIEDYTMTKKNKEGGIDKKLVKNKETGVSYQERGHFSDTKRYIICTILKELFEKFGNRNKKGRMGVIRNKYNSSF